MPYYVTALMSLLTQAGGGGTFGGGSSGSGGGSSGFGDGSGGFGRGGGSSGPAVDVSTLPVPLQIVFIVSVLLPFVLFFGFLYHLGRPRRTIRRARRAQESATMRAGLVAIRERDPDFDPRHFLARAGTAFETTQYAWSEQDLTSCRTFISDGVHERFQQYIAMQKEENIRNRMREVLLKDRSIVGVSSDRHFDTIHLRFVASTISYNEDLTTGLRVSGNSDRTPITFTEVWSFSRRPGVKTNLVASLLQGSCPNCGAAIEIPDRLTRGGHREVPDRVTCAHCESVVNSGRYDWVLTEITQDREWFPSTREDPPGWSELAEDDEGLNMQHVEDRASVIFWRSMMALYFDDMKYVAPVLGPAVGRLPGRWYLGSGRFWKTPAVGSVAVIGAERGEDFDRLRVLVRWSGTLAAGSRRHPKLLGQQRIYSHVLVLKRAAGVLTNVNHAFSSFSCQACGAPVGIGEADACGYCGSGLNDGSTDWVLEDVEPYRGIAPRRPSGGLGAPRLKHSQELLAVATRMAMTDGVLHDKERAYLSKFARKRGVPESLVDLIILTASDEDMDVPLPDGKEELAGFMDQLVTAALIDGRVSASERRLLLRVGERAGWTESELDDALARSRDELHRQAKEVLKAAKRN